MVGLHLTKKWAIFFIIVDNMNCPLWSLKSSTHKGSNAHFLCVVKLVVLWWIVQRRLNKKWDVEGFFFLPFFCTLPSTPTCTIYQPSQPHQAQWTSHKPGWHVIALGGCPAVFYQSQSKPSVFFSCGSGGSNMGPDGLGTKRFHGTACYWIHSKWMGVRVCSICWSLSNVQSHKNISTQDCLPCV